MDMDKLLMEWRSEKGKRLRKREGTKTLAERESERKREGVRESGNRE